MLNIHCDTIATARAQSGIKLLLPTASYAAELLLSDNAMPGFVIGRLVLHVRVLHPAIHVADSAAMTPAIAASTVAGDAPATRGIIQEDSVTSGGGPSACVAWLLPVAVSLWDCLCCKVQACMRVSPSEASFVTA